MTLYIYQPGVQPLGQFDIKDSYANLVKGGEVGTLGVAARTNSSSEKAAHDVLDGYTNLTDVKRACITLEVVAASRPLWLLDEGTTGYGTLFGQVIGSPVGLSTSGTNLGPNTTAGSGKVTCWDKPGLYAVSVDAVDTASDGIVVANANCDPGKQLGATNAGLLTISGATNDILSNTVVGNFVEFETSPFLVTTPPSLVGATEAVVRAVFSYHVDALV